MKIPIALMCAVLVVSVFPGTAYSDEWGATGTMNVQRYWSTYTATRLPSGKVLVTGGIVGSGVSNTCELFDPASGTWTMTGSLRKARMDHKAVLLPSGKVLVVGGLTAGHGHPVGDCELYDPATGTFSSARRCGNPLGGVALLSSGKVLVVGDGGATFQYLGASTQCSIYDPVANSWKATGSLNRPRAYVDVARLSTGKVLAASGYPFDEPAKSQNLGTRTCELFDPVTETWTMTGSFPLQPPVYGGYSLEMVPLSTGKILATWANNNSLGPRAYLYDPASGAWTATAATAVERLTVLGNGNVMGLFGNTARVYNTATASWSNGATSSVGSGKVSTLLASGKVLCSSGEHCSIYTP